MARVQQIMPGRGQRKSSRVAHMLSGCLCPCKRSVLRRRRFEEYFSLHGATRAGTGRRTLFGESLTFERPEVRAAVGYFLPPAKLRDSPKTQELLAKAPKIDFPLAQSTRDEGHSPLLQRFLR